MRTPPRAETHLSFPYPQVGRWPVQSFLLFDTLLNTWLGRKTRIISGWLEKKKRLFAKEILEMDAMLGSDLRAFPYPNKKEYRAALLLCKRREPRAETPLQNIKAWDFFWDPTNSSRTGMARQHHRVVLFILLKTLEESSCQHFPAISSAVGLLQHLSSVVPCSQGTVLANTVHLQ